MDRRNFLELLAGTVAASAVPVQANNNAPGAKYERPNIIFILTDDQASWALGASGNPEAYTPNLDRLVHEGARFTNAFITTPVCSPSRATLLTSRYGTELGIRDFIPQKGHKLYDPEHIIGLDPKIVTFPEVLADAGYCNGLFGKWHVGETDAMHPTQTGYREFMGFRGGGIDVQDPQLEKDGVESKFEGFTTEIITDHAIDFLKRRHQENFMMCVHYRAPHKPWLPVRDVDWKPYENLDPTLPNPDYPDLNVEKMKKWMCEYLASVTSVDRNVGRILDTLDDLNLGDNTIVIYTSDHGYNMAHHGIWHKGNGIWATHNHPPDTKNINGRYRPNLYDESLRVPVIVRWPGVVTPGMVLSQTITNLDWYPTLLAMCGAGLPQGEPIRGRNMVPLLKGETPVWDNDLYAEYSMENYCKTHMRMIRTEDWKLVRDFLNPERDEFYDLKNDPTESVNRIHDSNPEVQKVISGLHKRIIEKMRELGDPVLKLAEKN